MIFYSVEAENIAHIVELYGPCMHSMSLNI